MINQDKTDPSPVQNPIKLGKWKRHFPYSFSSLSQFISQKKKSSKMNQKSVFSDIIIKPSFIVNKASIMWVTGWGNSRNDEEDYWLGLFSDGVIVI